MARIGSVDRTTVPLTKVPESVRWAVLAAEDRNFYSEPGVSITGTVRAALNDVTGGNTQGGSGITQQYVKNAYLNSEQTLSRKLKELAIAVKLSRDYAKNQILEWYLNTVYFGRNAYGVEAASRRTSGRQSTGSARRRRRSLAALLRAPNYYDPANNPSESKARWSYVVEGMVETKHLTETQAAGLTFPKIHRSGRGQEARRDRADRVTGTTGDQRARSQRGQQGRDRYSRSAHPDDDRPQGAASCPECGISDLRRPDRSAKNIEERPGRREPTDRRGAPPTTADRTASATTARPTTTTMPRVGCRPPDRRSSRSPSLTVLTDNLQGKQPQLAINSIVNGNFTVTIDGTQISNDPSDRPYSGQGHHR